MKFKLYIYGECIKGQPFTYREVDSKDYDLDVGIARFEKTLYDIRTGYWLVTLEHIKKGKGGWLKSGCTPVEGAKQNEMLFIAVNNIKFMNSLTELRSKEEVLNLPTLNIIEKERTLFDL